MKNTYTEQDLQLAEELLTDQATLDKYGNRLFSWSDIQWALLVQIWFDKMKLAAIRLQRRFRFSYTICLRWAMRAFSEGTFKQLLYA